MSTRTLIILFVVFALLVGLAVYQARRPVGQAPPGGLAPGALLWPGLDVNQVAALEIVTPGGTSRVERKEGRWVVTSLYDYPADFQRLASTLRGLADLKVGQLVSDGAERAADYGLAPENNPLRVRLLDEGGQALAQLALGAVKARSGEGRGFPGYPFGRYVRAGEGPIVLVEGPQDLGGSSEDWMARELLNVPSRDAQEITVTASNSSFTLRVTEPGRYAMDGLGPREELDTTAASRLAGALQYLRCETVADPATPPEDLGFQAPTEFRLAARDGFRYKVLVSEKAPGEAQRYVRLDVDYEAPPAPTREEVAAFVPEEAPAEGGSEEAAAADREKKIEEEYARRLKVYEEEKAERSRRAQELKQRLAGWTFVVPRYATEALTMSRDQVVKVKEEAEDTKETKQAKDRKKR